MKDITSQTLRMYTHQRCLGLHVAHDQRDSFFYPAVAVMRGVPAKTVDAKLAPAGGKIG